MGDGSSGVDGIAFLYDTTIVPEALANWSIVNTFANWQEARLWGLSLLLTVDLTN
jgi:hypothetical protein